VDEGSAGPTQLLLRELYRLAGQTEDVPETRGYTGSSSCVGRDACPSWQCAHVVYLFLALTPILSETVQQLLATYMHPVRPITLAPTLQQRCNTGDALESKEGEYDVLSPGNYIFR